MGVVSSSESRFEQIATRLLAVTLLLAILGSILLALVPLGPTEPNTELYLVNMDGTAAGYQTELTPGETGQVVAGVRNDEGQTHSYTLVTRFPNREIDRSSFTLGYGESWNTTVEYTPQSVDEDQVVFELHRDSISNEPYRYTVLELSVNTSST